MHHSAKKGAPPPAPKHAYKIMEHSKVLKFSWNSFWWFPKLVEETLILLLETHLGRGWVVSISAILSLVKAFLDTRFLSQKSPWKKSSWTKVSLDKSLLGQKSFWTKVSLDKSLLGQKSPWTKSPWTKVSLDKSLLRQKSSWKIVPQTFVSLGKGLNKIEIDKYLNTL